MDSNSYTQSCYCFKFYLPNSINAFMKRGVEQLLFLFLPEDTTGDPDQRLNDYIKIGVNKTRNTFKAVFWITISVAATLAVGQLQ